MEETKVEKIPFQTVRVPNGDKPEGYEEVVSDGVDGTRTIVTVNGHVTSDRTVAPRNEVVYYGTKQEGEDEDSISSGDAADPVVHNTTETVSTPERPQEESEKQTPENDESDKDSFVPAETYKSNQSQGRLSQLGGKLKEMFNVNVQALKKAALEAGRLLVFAIPGILITVLTENPEVGGSLGATILLILKSIDRGIHEDKTSPSTGILPF